MSLEKERLLVLLRDWGYPCSYGGEGTGATPPVRTANSQGVHRRDQSLEEGNEEAWRLDRCYLVLCHMFDFSSVFLV